MGTNKQEHAKTPPVITKTDSRLLVCKLTDQELLERGETMANAQQALTEIDAELEAFKAQIKGRRSEQEGQISSMSSVIRQRYEHRRVECTITEDYGAATITVTRQDTGSEVEARKMTPDELSRLPL